MSDSKHDVTESIESGEYYRDAMRWYGTMYHSPISQRALLIIITVIALLITLMAVIGVFVMLPLSETKTMIVRVPESLSKVARVEQMTENPAQDPNQIVMNWFVSDFIKAREEYDIDKQQSYFKRVYVLSSPGVYDDYVTLFKSSQSPTVRYERHTTREVEMNNIRVESVNVVESATGSAAEVVDVTAKVKYTATETTPTDDRNSIWLADIAFRFSKIHVDQVTGDITPMEFKVTGYESKQLGLE